MRKMEKETVSWTRQESNQYEFPGAVSVLC